MAYISVAYWKRHKRLKRNISTSDEMELSMAECLELVDDAGDSIAELPQSVELEEAKKKSLDKSFKAYRKNHNAGSSCDEEKKKIWASR